MNVVLTKRQEEHLHKIIKKVENGHYFSFKICSKLLNDDDELINDFYTDGADDRGIDFIHIRINNEVCSLDKAMNIIDKGNISSVNISIFQCKNKNTNITSISDNEFEKISSFFSSIERFCRGEKTIKMNPRIKRFVNLLEKIYINQQNIQNIYFEYNYIHTALDFDEFKNEKVKNDIGRNIEDILKKIFGKIKITYNVFSRVTLNDLYSKYCDYRRLLCNFYQTIEDNDSILGLINADDFFKCITNSKDSNIQDYINNFNDIIFDNNVRSFLGKNKVNKAIIETCKNIINEDNNKKMISFWEKNNGITILCDNYKLNTNGVMEIYNLKIINGLQTISSIYDFLKNNSDLSLNRLKKIKIMLKIIKRNGLSEKEIEKIIIATNSQTHVKYLDLVSIDKNLQILEFKLYDDKIDYVRKKKQKSKENCSITIKHNELLQLIITCFRDGPSSAKNKLEGSLYYKNDFNEKILIDFKPYWNSEKYEKLVDAIKIYNILKSNENKEKDNQVMKYAKLHTTYYIINILDVHQDECNQEKLKIYLKDMENLFDNYRKYINKDSTIEQMSKNISKKFIDENFNNIKD